MSFRLSDNEAEILRLLAGKEMFGQQMIECSNGRLKRTTLYVRLGRMLEKGLLTAHHEEVDDPTLIPRRLYRVTSYGQQVLAAYDSLKRYRVALPEGGVA